MRITIASSARLFIMPTTLILGSVFCLAANGQENWGQWRGPSANGVSKTATPPVEFSDTKNVKWKAEIPGKGSSTPIIWDANVFILTAVDTGRPGQSDPGAEENGDESGQVDRRPTAATVRIDPQENEQQEGSGRSGRRGRRRGRGGSSPTTLHDFMILCFNKDTGDEVWRTTLTTQVPHEPGHSTNNFASTSPVTNGEHIFVNYGSRGVYCLDMKGEVVWKKDFGKMTTRAGFGEGASPALYENTLVVPWDHEEQSALIALDTKTGNELWRVERDEPTTWATPLIAKVGEQVQVVTNGTTVRSYDLANGDLIWECGGQASNPIPTPLLVNENVICMTGYRGYAIVSTPLESQGDVTDKIAWKADDAAPYVPSPVIYDGKIYFNKGYTNVIAARDATTGDEYMEQTRLPDARSVYASPVAADDKIYFCSREGNVVVIKPGPQLDVLAVNEMNEEIDASPALVGNRIYLRGAKHLFCIEAN